MACAGAAGTQDPRLGAPTMETHLCRVLEAGSPEQGVGGAARPETPLLGVQMPPLPTTSHSLPPGQVCAQISS